MVEKKLVVETASGGKNSGGKNSGGKNSGGNN